MPFGALVGGQLAYATNSLRVPYLAAGFITLSALAVFVKPVLRGANDIDLAHARDLTPAPPSMT